MKLLFSFILLYTSLFSLEAKKEVQIGAHMFILKQQAYNEYGDKGITLMVYDKASVQKGVPLLSFVMENKSGGCADKSVQKGTYKIEGNSLTFYSHWERYGRAYDAAIGDRVQVYTLDDKGTLHRTNSKVYIETSKRGKEVDEGMKYLYTETKTDAQRQALAKYIISVERIFEAKFVKGNAAKVLAEEVSNALREKQKQRWQ